MEYVSAAVTAGLATLFDLDRTFYVPANFGRKSQLYVWWWTFIIANGLLAAFLYAIFSDLDALRSVHPWLRPVIVGLTYLALIRVKFTTFSFQGKDVPFGLELFYEAAKGYVYKRINAIAKNARSEEAEELAKKELKYLISRAKNNIDADALLNPEEKRRTKAWLVKIITASIDEDETRRTLAFYILSGQHVDELS